MASPAPVLVRANFPAVVRTQIAVPIGIGAVAVCQAAVGIRARPGVPVHRAAAVLVRTQIAELILPVIETVSPVRRGQPWLRATLPILPAAFPLRRNWRQPIPRAGFRLSPPLGTPALGLVGIPVSGRERVRPYGHELA
jgi:hypothetical protein